MKKNIFKMSIELLKTVMHFIRYNIRCSKYAVKVEF